MASRIPPQNLEAEQSVLGSLLIDKEAVFKVADRLRPEYFYREVHGDIYAAITALYDRREPADMITVPAELKKMGKLEKVGGLGYLTDLVSAVPTAANVIHYASLIRDSFTRRRLIEASTKVVEMSYGEASDTAALLDRAEQALFGISQESLRRKFTPLKDVLEISFDRLDELQKSPGSLRGVPTGLRSLDHRLSGLRESELIILAARPSLGKTSLALNIAQHAAVKKKIPLALFSLETSAEQLTDRFLAAQGEVDGWKIATGRLGTEEFRRIGEAMGVLAEAPIFIDDTPGISVMEMRTKARRLQMEQGIKLIVVDYLQLIHGRGLESRVQEVSEISQALKNLARELRVPVLALSQLSRAVESRGGSGKPQLSDLRESGSIEQDADVVMFLYRPDAEDREMINLLIAKHRNGPTGEMSLYFKGSQTRFFEIESKQAAGGELVTRNP